MLLGPWWLTIHVTVYVNQNDCCVTDFLSRLLLTFHDSRLHYVQGYNRVDAGKFNSRGFALGNVVKRVQDWCDWMAPEAWNVEHNRLHHYHLGEDKDPDLVQRNLEFLRDSQEPMYQKYATVLALMPIWKWAYYAPNSTLCRLL